MMIMNARQLPWLVKIYWDIWKIKEVILQRQPFQSIFKQWILSVEVMLDRICSRLFCVLGHLANLKETSKGKGACLVEAYKYELLLNE